MSMILHIRGNGHQCHNPLKTPAASYIKAGEMLGMGDWFLQWSDRQRAYFVIRNNLKGDYYQFTNFNCAAAKLAELGSK